MESNKKSYIAVTVGPIFDTMSLVSTPAALWISSYMFSCITKEICESLCKDRTYGEDVPNEERITPLDEKKIITPYYSHTNTALLDKKDGVGLFHDHIIFEADGWDITKFDLVKQEVLEKISEIFEIPLNYLQQYVQIAAVKYRAENPIFGCENMLNSRELEKPFVAKDSDQPLLNLLFARKGAANEWIKALAAKLGVYEKWQLTEGKDIKDLNAIVKTQKGSTLKKHSYYAIVRSDGDNMSKIISSLTTDEEFRSFSKTCLSYCSAISDEVASFGGVTIYAGGDDLLAILPCENKNGDTPFEFIKSANRLFNEKFESYHKPTSLSFGISMCYKKFPLYEALDDSAYLLFGVAKDKDHKNCSVIHLQKHAGQSEGLLIPNSALDELLKLKGTIVKPASTAPAKKTDGAEASCSPDKQTSDGEAEEKNERIIVSALHKLSLFEPLLKAMNDDREAVFTLFKNMFDSGEQQTAFLHEKLPDFYHKLKTDVGIRALTDDGVQSNPVTTISYVLRVLKFFNEKAGDRE